MKHEFSFEVRGYEMDSFNHVNNAVYLNYFEAERWSFFKDTKWLDYMEQKKLYAVVVEANIKYISELRVFDKAVIRSKWRYEGERLIADQSIYFENTKKKAAKATIQMMLVSDNRVVHDLPDFIKAELDKEV